MGTMAEEYRVEQWKRLVEESRQQTPEERVAAAIELSDFLHDIGVEAAAARGVSEFEQILQVSAAVDKIRENLRRSQPR